MPDLTHATEWLWLFPRKPGWGLRGCGGKEEQDRESFSGTLDITNGVGTSCGWRNGDQASLGWALAAQSACSVAGILLSSWDQEGCGVGTWWVWSVKAELVSPFSLSDSKGSLEPHKPGERPAEIAALSRLLNINN